MKITFVQDNQSLRLTSNDRPVQFGDNIPVEITVDNEYAGATEIVLLTQAYKSLPVRCTLALSGRTASGTISRAQLMQSGTVNFVMSGKIDDMVLPTAAAKIDVLPSIDPQGTGLAQNPATIKDVVAEVVSKVALSVSGYDGTSDLGKIAVVDKNGNLAVRGVHLLIDEDTDGGALVLRGAVGQIIAEITLSELKEAVVGNNEPEAIGNSYWSGYKYPDGRAVLKWNLDVQNKALNSSNGAYVTDKLFNSSYRKYPDVFVEKPEFRAVYVPSPNRVHASAYTTLQRGNSEQASGSGGVYYYQTPPDVYIACNDNTNTTLLGELCMVAEGRWK